MVARVATDAKFERERHELNIHELTALLDRLCVEPREPEWLESKINHCEPQVLGEYLSAACLLGKPCAYLVFGLRATGSHMMVATN